MVLKSLEFRLSKDGYDIIVAVDGKQAMEIIEKGKYDLVITDLMLPFITGNQLIEHIKKVTPSTPVIVLSTATQEEIIMDAFNMGVDDFITKPFSPNELSLRVKRTLSKF